MNIFLSISLPKGRCPICLQSSHTTLQVIIKSQISPKWIICFSSRKRCQLLEEDLCLVRSITKAQLVIKIRPLLLLRTSSKRFLKRCFETLKTMGTLWKTSFWSKDTQLTWTSVCSWPRMSSSRRSTRLTWTGLTLTEETISLKECKKTKKKGSKKIRRFRTPSKTPLLILEGQPIFRII